MSVLLYSQIEDKLVTALSFVECASSSNPFAVREHMPVLVPALRRLLRTPLGAQLACRTWLRLRPVAFDAEDGQMWLGKNYFSERRVCMDFCSECLASIVLRLLPSLTRAVLYRSLFALSVQRYCQLISSTLRYKYSEKQQ